MLNQNITTLLAALIGGLLSISGGFLANYYIQSSTDKLSKRKEIRNMLEQIYKKTQSARIDYCAIAKKIATKDEFENELTHLAEIMYQIEFLVDFYLHPLEKDFSVYSKPIWQTIDMLETESPNCNVDYISLNKSTMTFREAIIELSKKGGYNYF